VAKPRCDQCRFWELLPEAHQELSSGPDEDGGQCRRFPPVLNQPYLQTQKRLAEESLLFTGWSFPVTQGIDWCGEFKPKEDLIS
jgi:hypothetical protein